ncbi:hypothetical protein C3941_07090 [Kaistia algarum]|uniref:MmcQ/YjbR family DNA-binding protein n=1 Tax=Kaistia algarum TaxID=2083279 RepID=UPI000CE77291|nr:hypothetical protein [Kaistia algarum]MCX5515559.1 MmcQ/YjbR family DNA-binding protein [Kaistia algarum]PPE81043.1 hypothetical protein C3941_07090 [Kaistia algarum]
MPVDVDDLRRLFLALPGVAESTHHGTISFVVAKRFLGRLRDDDTVFAMRCDLGERGFLIEFAPDVFFITDHYRGYPYVLVRLAAANSEQLQPLVERCWRMQATRRLVAAFDKDRPSGLDGSHHADTNDCKSV